MNKCICLLWLLVVLCPQCGAAASQALGANDLNRLMTQALGRAYFFVAHGQSTNAAIAIVDREGFVLETVSLQAAGITVDATATNLAVIDAITKAGTAAFLSSDQNAFTSRTAGYIVQQHFPPHIRNTAPGPLVGVNFSSLAFSDVNFYKNPAGYSTNAYGGGGTNGLPITTNLALEALTGLNGSPGGMPLYIDGQLVGGIGAAVKGKGLVPELDDIQLTTGESYDTDEDVALAGQKGYGPAAAIEATRVLINGIRLPYANSSSRAGNTPIDPAVATLITNYAPMPSPTVSYPQLVLGGTVGEVREPIIGDPVPGTIEGVARLSASEVSGIIATAAANAITIRSLLRVPVPKPTRMFISVVNNPNQPNVTPTILGTFRMTDAPMFSWDIAVQKARTVVFFSSDSGAFSTRAIGFLAQTFYPPGIDGEPPGPLLGVQDVFSLLQPGVVNPLEEVSIVDGRIPAAPFVTPDFNTSVPLLNTQPFASIPLAAPVPSLTNGITIFPGGFPLYRDGVLIGGIGVSGDGVDEDDLVAAWGTVNFEANPAIRSDQITYRGTRLPYAKFPRNPSL